MRLLPGLPHPADFPAPPSPADRARWADADRVERPRRVDRLRRRMAEAGCEAYFGVGPENSRYLTGFRLEDGEEKVSGQSGMFLVGREDVVLLADSRYRVQAQREAPESRIEEAYHDLAERWPAIVGSVGAKRVAVESARMSHSLWESLRIAAPEVELVAVDGWIEADRALKEPAEVERIAAAAAVADRALASTLRRIRPGVAERDLALALEWEIRTGGGDGLAFGVACLAGPQAALPHGSPGDREAQRGQVLLFDFGAQVDGYRSDMTRTLFVGEPTERDFAIYGIVAKAQAAARDLAEKAARGEIAPPSGRAVDLAAREVIEAAGYGDNFGHGTGHGIGLATHELPSLGRKASEDPLTGPTVFSVEPGIYVDGETGVRIEDLVLFDPGARQYRVLNGFPREPMVVGV